MRTVSSKSDSICFNFGFDFCTINAAKFLVSSSCTSAVSIMYASRPEYVLNHRMVPLHLLYQDSNDAYSFYPRARPPCSSLRISFMISLKRVMHSFFLRMDSRKASIISLRERFFIATAIFFIFSLVLLSYHCLEALISRTYLIYIAHT